MSTAAAEVLEGALARLERDGWNQGPYIEPEKTMPMMSGCDPCCAQIAVARAMGYMGNHDLWLESIGFLARAIDAEHPTVIVRWNDQAGRTFDEVRTAFQRAIEAARAA
jgi:hypothetical protein